MQKVQRGSPSSRFHANALAVNSGCYVSLCETYMNAAITFSPLLKNLISCNSLFGLDVDGAKRRECGPEFHSQLPATLLRLTTSACSLLLAGRGRMSNISASEPLLSRCMTSWVPKVACTYQIHVYIYIHTRSYKYKYPHTHVCVLACSMASGGKGPTQLTRRLFAGMFAAPGKWKRRSSRSSLLQALDGHDPSTH